MRKERWKYMLIIGSHISFSKGYEDMGKQAVELGANTFAFFTRNPREIGRASCRESVFITV